METLLRPTTPDESRIYLSEFIPDIAGKYSGMVRIIGGGSTMWDDLAKSEKLMPGSDKIAVNVSGIVVPELTHLFSWHHKQISAIKDFRQAEWPDDKAIVHSVKEYKNVDVVWKFEGMTSVSGMTAVELAWLLGYRKIALVGVPQDGSGYFYKAKTMQNPDMFDRFRKNEIFKLYELFGQAVKSFSGETARVLGEPTEEWVNGNL